MNTKTNSRIDKGSTIIHIFSWSWIIWLVAPYLFLFYTLLFKSSILSLILGDDRFWSALLVSVSSAFIVVLFTLIFSLPLAYFLTYINFRYKFILESLLIDIPQTFPPVAVGVIYLFMLGPNTPLNIAYTFLALVIAKIIVSAPFTLGYSLRKFREIKDSKIDLVARSLGANTGDVFFKILIPISRREITAGLTLSWARAMGEFGGSLIFAGVVAYHTEILPTYTNRVVNTDPYRALVATAVITIFAFFTIIIVRSLARQKNV